MSAYKKIIPSIIFSLSIFVFFGSFFYVFSSKKVDAAAYSPLTHSLSVGMTSSDVVTLQQILNSDPATAVAASGIGSLGHETTYFGALTKQAVIKFQNKYSTDILIPSGLSSGNGYVGPLTLKQLNSFALNLQNGSITTQTTVNSSQNNQLSSSGLVDHSLNLYSVTPYQVAPGGTITLGGTGFSTNQNTVTIGQYSLQNQTSSDAQHITIVVPQVVPSGTYNLGITSNGITAKTAQNKPVSIVVTQNPSQAPTITSVSPAQVSGNDTVTITGTGFTSDTTIITALGTVTHLNSTDGKTLTFIPSQLSSFSKAAAIQQKAAALSGAGGLIIPIIAVTSAGYSQQSPGFILK
ncbi:MAG TPA: peptidoglycan-binding domain-containing protein [Candidatus Babeliales bacterium]|nr:peptidoglycan-binding domain-containing protein [Candidatus Babeliales bacterium]